MEAGRRRLAFWTAAGVAITALVIVIPIAGIRTLGGRKSEGPDRLDPIETPALDEPESVVSDTDGSDLRRLTNSLFDERRPAWSPDRSRIAFSSNRDGTHAIYVMGADGSSVRRLTTGGACDGWPAWSPDGTHIAFTRDRVPGSCPDVRSDDTRFVYVIDADGSGLRELTAGGEPSWSPDGRRLAVSCVGGCEERGIFLINVDGSGKRRLETGLDRPGGVGGIERGPAWSPDGKRIAFSWCECFNRTGQELYAVTPDGTDLEGLPVTGEYASNPAWSPDGTRIAFSVLPDRGNPTGGRSEIYEMGLDGSGPGRAISSGAEPVYMPRPRRGPP